MTSGFKSFLQRWVINMVAVLVATYFAGLHYRKPVDLLVATLILGILNALVRPILLLLSLPLLVLTLGLFTLIINAILLWLVGKIMSPHFYVDGFGSAIWGAFIISVVSIILNSLMGTNDSKIRAQKSSPPPPPPRDDGGGPVIDV